MSDQNIYKRQDLMDVYKNPPNQGKIDNASVSVVERNPMCGDVVILDLLIENGKIRDAKFMGEQCSVSIISAAFLTEEIIGMTVDEAKNMSKEDLLNLIDLELTTSRVKCATIILDALKNALGNYEQKR